MYFALRNCEQDGLIFVLHVNDPVDLCGSVHLHKAVRVFLHACMLQFCLEGETGVFCDADDGCAVKFWLGDWEGNEVLAFVEQKRTVVGARFAFSVRISNDDKGYFLITAGFELANKLSKSVLSVT